MIDTLEFVHSESEDDAEVMQLLEGEVFHVTPRKNWAGIQQAGAICPNTELASPSAFGDFPNSYFRQRGCVSLFDYREFPTDEIWQYRNRCHPLMGAEPGGEGIAILILHPSIHESLIPWTLWKDEQAWSQRVVPHAEAGCPEPVSCELVVKVVFFRREVDPDCLAAKLRRGCATAA